MNQSISLITKREFEVLKLIANEFTTSEIAAQLYISSETAKTHRKNLLIKTDARNVAGMIRRAFEIGWLKVS